MIPRVNEVVFLAHLPDWGQTPKTERRWQSAIASSLAGVEERASLRQTPIRTLSWRVTPFDAAERGTLDDQLRVALLEGAAATPWWGRGLAVIEASGTTVTLSDSVPADWVPAVGSHIAFMGPWATAGGAAWEVAEVESVDGRTLTLSESLAGTWSGACWELISGMLSVQDGEAMTDHTGPVDLRIEGVRGVVEPYAYATPPATECPADTYAVPPAIWPPPSGLTLARVRLPESGILGLMYTALVEYEPDPELADTATMEVSTDLTTWSAVDSNQVRRDPDLAARWQCRMRFREQFWLRASIVVEDETITTDPLLIPALTPESMMRVIQERREDTGGAQFSWPYGAPAYPPDGWYDGRIESDGDTAVAAILESMRQALRTTGFLRNFINVSGTVTANWRVTPRPRAFTSEWGVTPGSGFTPPAYDAPLSETGLATAITGLNWVLWWDDIARVCLQLYKRIYSPTRTINKTKLGAESQATGDMKPLILSSGGLGEECQDAYDLAPPADSSDPFGIRTVIEPASVTDYAWGQTYNAPGQVRMWFSTGSWYESVEGLTGEKQIYRSAYYTGYDLAKIGVVLQNGCTPYYEWAGDTGLYYVGFGYPTNVPTGEYHASATAHTEFTSVGVIPFMADEEEVREIIVHSGLLDPVTSEPSEGGDVPFTWLDVFNTTSRPLRDLGVEMVARVSWYRSPWPEDGHWDQYIHQPAPE